MAVRVEIVHDHVQSQPAWIAGPQTAKGHQDISCRLPTPTGAHQAVVVDVIESEKLFRPLRAAIRGALAPGMADPSQPNAGNRPQFQRPPFVETDHRAASGPPLVEAEDARFLLRTRDRATASTS